MRHVPLLLLLAFLCFGCDGFLNDEPRISFRNGNVLLPQIKFGTEKNDQVYIEYWPELQPERIQVSKVSEGMDHAITLVNLTQLTTYQFAIRRTDKSRKSKTFTFMTGAIPELAFRPEKVKIDSTLFDGYILVRRLAKSGADAIINKEGDVVWYNLYDKTVRRAFSWTKHQSIISTYDSAEIVEIDLMGNEILDMNLEGINISNKLHHEIMYNQQDQIAVLTLDSARMDLRKYGGMKDQMLRGDGLIVLDRQGKKIWEWNILQHTNPNVLNIGPFDLTDSWGHANSFAYDKDGNFVVSFRDFNQVWKINSVDGSIMWRLGKGGDFEMDADSYFMRQHSIHFNKKGELMMFDNGSPSERPISRVMCFRLDERGKKAVTTVKVDLPLDLSGYRMCSAEYIADGRYLVCTTRRGGTITVVNDEGGVLWKLDLKTPSYRAYYLEDPFHTSRMLQ